MPRWSPPHPGASAPVAEGAVGSRGVRRQAEWWVQVRGRGGSHHSPVNPGGEWSGQAHITHTYTHPTSGSDQGPRSSISVLLLLPPPRKPPLPFNQPPNTSHPPLPSPLGQTRAPGRPAACPCSCRPARWAGCLHPPTPAGPCCSWTGRSAGQGIHNCGSAAGRVWTVLRVHKATAANQQVS